MYYKKLYMYHYYILKEKNYFLLISIIQELVCQKFRSFISSAMFIIWFAPRWANAMSDAAVFWSCILMLPG